MCDVTWKVFTQWFGGRLIRRSEPIQQESSRDDDFRGLYILASPHRLRYEIKGDR